MANNPLTAEELADISNPAANYVENVSANPSSQGMTAEELADLSNPAANYNQPVGLTPEEESTFGIPAEAYLEDKQPKQSNVEAFDEKGAAQGKSQEPNINKDTTAQAQIGMYQNPGFFGDQSMKNSDVAFNKAINMCTAVAGFAVSLQTAKPPPNYVRTQRNYILTDREKELIERKAGELSLAGVIPLNVLRTFLYILAALENPYELKYVAQVTGINELENQIYVRNITGILGIQEIYKIGYLANAVVAVISAFSSQYGTASVYADPYRTSIANLQQSIEISRALGVLAPMMITTAQNFSGNIGVLNNPPALTDAAIERTVQSVATLATGAAISISGPIGNSTANIKNLATQVGVSVVLDVLKQTPLGGALRQFGIMGGLAAGPILQQFGGYAVGSFMSELLTGSRFPTQKIANNPSLRPPSYAGKAFFGETPCALPAVDQLFCRKVGSFGNPTGGCGADSFGMQNFASFGGSQSIGSVVARMVTGSGIVPPTTTYYGQQIATMISNVSNILNVSTGTSIEMRRSDNAIPFMIGLSAAIAQESFSPFESRTMMDGWKMASSTANDIQKTNPQYLETCKTSL